MNAPNDPTASTREEFIFDCALALSPPLRASYLDRICGGDAALRQRIEALLTAHGDSEGFLEMPPSANGPSGTIAVAPATEERAGDVIGRYKIREKLGEGGCGAVYVAEQSEPVRRRVALKVIKPGMDTRTVIARFEAERQALAMMDHPNIAKVLDAGTTESGRPFFVMELVRGIRITDYCDQNNLDTAKRIELFIKVCQAVQHAHQKGIIHRDLKPSNILVTLHDGAPVPKVIDFGIAKATDGRLTEQTVYTQLYEFIGTPAYISPEQAEMSGLDIDTRSDIYSLGVLLYELLTGKTPFDSKELIDSGLDGMRRTIREAEPMAPSTRLNTMVDNDLTDAARRRSVEGPRLVHFVKGDLDWIVMKALEKDRTRRFETANAMAADLRRFLQNEPVEARPPSSWYRFQKMARRNKAAFAAVSGIAAALVLGLAVSLHLYFKEREEMRMLRQAEVEEVTLRKQAETGLEIEREARAHAEVGQKLWQAGVLMSQDKMDEAAELMKGVPLIPQSTAIWNVLGMVNARYQRLDKAITNYMNGANAQPTNYLAFHCLLPLLARTGRTNEYAEWRSKTLDEYETTREPEVAENLALDFLLLPTPEAEVKRVLKMLDSGEGSHPTPFAELARGLAEYREGQYEAAAQREAKAMDQQSTDNAKLQARLVMALAKRKLGEEIDMTVPKPVWGAADWNEQTITQLLTAELRGGPMP
jgi:serine/threonine protein kinase